MNATMLPALYIETTTRTDCRTEREITCYTPVFRPDVTALGELRFAVWEVWATEPTSAHAAAQQSALANARACLARYASETH